ncbi:hypothetical protein RJT34_04420 [Clitoria ternatea]|uniref:Uncharacterized protein n=1 Tax=Clitoria ternatea TaxID=43366 RepID=A0AAN9KL92_CLITE
MKGSSIDGEGRVDREQRDTTRKEKKRQNSNETEKGDRREAKDGTTYNQKNQRMNTEWGNMDMEGNRETGERKSFVGNQVKKKKRELRAFIQCEIMLNDLGVVGTHDTATVGAAKASLKTERQEKKKTYFPLRKYAIKV